jgi:hypothetical protein
MKNIFKLLFLLFLFTSCEKEIELDLSDQSGKLVIEGNVTDQPGPYMVKITRSVPFTQDNRYPAVKGAIVTITDNGGQQDKLIEAGDGTYKTTTLVTSPGNTYTLTVVVDGVTFKASSTLPLQVGLESLKQDSIKFGGEVRYAIRPIYTDPIAIGNNYRFIISLNGKPTNAYNLISDNIDNGKVNQRAFPIASDDDIEEPKIGDIIGVEMHGIDAAIYTYYNALSEIAGGRGGGVTPANPPSNISGGALGRFSAYTISKKTIVFK